jgi:Zn-dependent protease with chaperone function
MILHSLEQYGAADREEARNHFRFGNHASVMAVVERSPAANAGLAADDRLLSINGVAVAVSAAAPKPIPSRAFLQRAQQALVEAMEKGEVVLRVAGPRGEREVRFRADRGCPAAVELLPSSEVNAWADGERVVVSAGILRRCRSDDDLALVIAHELAHNLLRHGRRSYSPVNGQGRLSLPADAAPRGAQESEEEADRLAVRLARAAGYDLTGAESFLTGLAGAGTPVLQAGTHPPLERRLTLLRAEIAAAKH